SKDCAYEGPIMKAIAGVPISMEGKSAACAHFSAVGNIASAMCDLWSNESVQNVRLLSGNAPEAFAELLEYDCRLMNAASARGQAKALRDLLTLSDQWLSPQAAVLSPAATIEIARAIVAKTDPYDRTAAAGKAAVALLDPGRREGRLALARKRRSGSSASTRRCKRFRPTGAICRLSSSPNTDISTTRRATGSREEKRERRKQRERPDERRE